LAHQHPFASVDCVRRATACLRVGLLDDDAGGGSADSRGGSLNTTGDASTTGRKSASAVVPFVTTRKRRRASRGVDSEQPDLRLGWIPTPTAAWMYRVEGACMDVRPAGAAAVAGTFGKQLYKTVACNAPCCCGDKCTWSVTMFSSRRKLESEKSTASPPERYEPMRRPAVERYETFNFKPRATAAAAGMTTSPRNRRREARR
jgi:hypothetical protein